MNAANFAGGIAAYPFVRPLHTAATIAPIAAGALANNIVGNPIGGAIDAVTGNVWNLKADDGEPVAHVLPTNPLNDAATLGERAVAYQRQMQEEATSQQLEAELATQLLNGYLSMIQQR